MKAFLILLIRFYWRFWPAQWKRRCLFSESCSRHVYRITASNGFLKGFSALGGRIIACRPGYDLVVLNDCLCVRTSGNLIIPESEVNPQITNYFHSAIKTRELM